MRNVSYQVAYVRLLCSWIQHPGSHSGVLHRSCHTSKTRRCQQAYTVLGIPHTHQTLVLCLMWITEIFFSLSHTSKVKMHNNIDIANIFQQEVIYHTFGEKTLNSLNPFINRDSITKGRSRHAAADGF